VTKLNPTGSALVYPTYLGGTAVGRGMAIAIDADGNAYVTGLPPPTSRRQRAPFSPSSAAAFPTPL